MQNFKGIVRFFTILLILVCCLQLSFTFMARTFEGRADEYASKYVPNTPAPTSLNATEQLVFQDSLNGVRSLYRRAYLDSVLNLPLIDAPVLNEISTYKFSREHALSLGLDLKGGMSITLEIKEDDVLRSLSGDSKSQNFNKAIENAVKAQANTQGDFLTLFKKEFEALNKDAKLAAVFAPLPAYEGKITVNSTNDEVISVLRKDYDAAIKNTFTVIKTRIDQFGVASPNVSLQENTGRIMLELPGVEDPERVRKLLQQTAKLEFWETYENKEIGPVLEQVNTLVRDMEAKEKASASTTSSLVDTTALASDTTANDTSLFGGAAAANKDAVDTTSNPYPFYQLLNPAIDRDKGAYLDGPMVGYALGRDTAKINSLLAKPEIKALLPRDLSLLWSAYSLDKNTPLIGLYAIKKSTQVAPLSGDVITDAVQSFDQSNRPEVSLTMNALGANKWERMTDAAVNGNVNGQPIKRCIAIVLDNKVFSAPRVQSKIAGGRSSITGSGDLTEAIDLANILKSGKLDAGTRIIEEQLVGPSLGKESIKAGLLSLAIGFAMVFVFMVLYYSTSGAIANIAMLLNLFILVSLMVSFGAAFTLPAMAGILLTLAMAVDANVIINERIREELARGKGIKLAVEEGYKHSYNAIIDGNLTTMVVSIVLMVFGLGPIYGFGFVLFMGLLTSMFTAVLVSQALFDSAFKRNINISFGNSFTMGLFKGTNIDFIGKKKVSYAVSIVVFAVFISSMLFYGFDLGVDFKGGRSYVVQFDKDVTTDAVIEALDKPLEGAPIVKTYGSSNQLSITTAYKIEDAAADSLVEAKLYEGLKGQFAQDPGYDNFRTKNVKSSVKIGATVADDIRSSAFYAVFFGLLGVFLYIFVRFRKWEYATGAVIGLIHDPIIVLGVFSLFRKVIPFPLEIDQNIVAAVLTLIGYSVNDTVVVFDRIRETIALHPTRPLVQNVNDSINQTLSRTIMTVFTVFIVSLILFIFGGASIRGFSFALLIGLLVGTYSSIFVASPIMVDLMSRKNKVK